MKELIRHSAITIAIAVALCVSASSASAAEQAGNTAGSKDTPEAKAGTPQTKDVLTKLHDSNQLEIQMGREAKENGKSQEVRNFGDTLVKDHTVADEKVAALARKKNIDLSAAGHPAENPKDMVPPGPNFDKQFSKMMIEDHKKDIDEVKSARDQTSDPDLKTLLTELLPTLEKHREIAERTEKM